MRRITAALTALLMAFMLFCCPAHAAQGELTLTYVPRTERGTVFYLELSYDGTLSAAMFELAYDSTGAVYQDIAAEAATTTVKAKAENGVVKVVFGDSKGVNGRLCRLTFKALAEENASFTLRMTEGVDGDLGRINAAESVTLTVPLGSSSGASRSSKDGASGSAYGGSKSVKKSASSDSADPEDEMISRDLRRSEQTRPFLLGAAAAAVLMLLILLGFLLGRRSMRKKKKPADPPAAEEQSPPDEIEEDHPDQE